MRDCDPSNTRLTKEEDISPVFQLLFVSLTDFFNAIWITCGDDIYGDRDEPPKREIFLPKKEVHFLRVQ